MIIIIINLASKFVIFQIIFIIIITF